MSFRSSVFISIRAPRAGRDTNKDIRYCISYRFQSARPVRGATSRPKMPIAPPINFNPRAPCGARRGGRQTGDVQHQISIRAPRAGRDVRGGDGGRRAVRFQSARPVRGATISLPHLRRASGFQSARPVRGATPAGGLRHCQGRDFNPRAPCGARRQASASPSFANRFQSARPVRGATITIQSMDGKST